MKSILIILQFFLYANLYSQDIVIHWLANQDSITDCSMIKSGKFLNEESCDKITPGYSIEIRGNMVTELVNDGEFYMKSKIDFTSDCAYELTILESTIPGDNIIGSKVYVEVIGTSKIDNLIMIKTLYAEEQTFVLKKVKN